MAQPSRWLSRLVGGAVSPRTRARTLSKALITAGVDSAEDAEPFLLQPLVSLGFTPVEARVVMKAYLSEERGADAAAAAPAVEEEAEDGPAASPSAAPADAKDAAPPKKRQRSIAAAFAGGAPDSEAGSEAPGTSTDGMAPADFPAVWREHYGGSLLTMNEEEMAPSAKVAGFDMDGCLIDTRSGRAFPTNANDWQLRFPGKLEARMRALRGDGYKLVVFTNQLGIEKGKTKAADIRAKIAALSRAIGEPVQALVATDKSRFRKPATGMWSHFVEHCNRPAGGGEAVPVDLRASVFVGDAAGRAADKARKVKKDHSASDYKFALNIGVPFHTPEAFFGGSRAPRDTDESRWELGFDPGQMRAWMDRPVFPSLPDGAAEGGPLRAAEGEPPRLVVLTGAPGSGKSALARGQLAHCERVNQDALKTVARCEKAARAALEEQRSVVIDATNRDKRTRARWTRLAKEFGARAVAVWVDVPLEAAFHGNAYRAVAPGDGPDTGRRVPDMIIYAFRKQFEMPTTAEGFSDVVRAQLVPGPFESDDHERLYFSYLT